MTDESPSPILSAALAYALQGWRVLPLHSIDLSGACTCGKLTCASPGKHPRTPHGLKDASTDETVVRRWWGKWPFANVGICTGAASDLIVLDSDPRHGGNASLAALEAQFASLPLTATVQTGGGGWHFYFKGVLDLPSSAGKVGPGLDIRAEGGYVVAPPSTHASGRHYEWRGDWDGASDLIGFAVAPEWLIALASAKPTLEMRPSASIGSSETAVPDNWWSIIWDGAVEGSRNSTATRFAGYLFRHGHEPDVVFSLVMLWNTAACKPPLEQDEIVQIVESICRAESRKRSGK